MVVNIEYFVSMFCISIKNISVYTPTYLCDMQMLLC